MGVDFARMRNAAMASLAQSTRLHARVRKLTDEQLAELLAAAPQRKRWLLMWERIADEARRELEQCRDVGLPLITGQRAEIDRRLDPEPDWKEETSILFAEAEMRRRFPGQRLW